jgi:uncharacterized protein YecE (DUF72 family)
MRALTPPRISYKKSVEIAEPFDRLVSECPDAISAILETVRISQQRRIRLYAYINNRLEGCAPLSIARIIELLEKKPKA